MSGKIEARLKELGIELPQPTAPLANYVPFTIAGNLVFIAGQISQWNGERGFVGKLGAGISIDDGQQAARICALNIIAHLRVAAGGDLDRVRRCLRLGGCVNRTPAPRSARAHYRAASRSRSKRPSSSAERPRS